MNVILFGFKGSGKTYFGRLMSLKNVPWIDTDQELEKVYKKNFGKNFSCREIFLIEGENFFRTLEKDVLKALLGLKNTLITLGGGAVLDSENQNFLGSLGQMVYLKVPKEVIQERVFQEKNCFFIDPKDPENSFEEFYEKRLPLYENISSLCLDGMKEKNVIETLSKLILG